jgi:hypothetical protein
VIQGIAAAAVGAAVKLFTGDLVGKVFGLADQYFKKEISEAEFRSRVEIAGQESAVKIESAWAQAATDTARATQATLAGSPVLQRAWAAVLFLQVAILAWYQIGTPAFQVITGQPWPNPGVVLEWAYALIGVQLGAGPLVFRRGATAQ